MTQINIYWQIVKRGWWIILLTAVVAVVASLIYSSISPRIYRTTTRFIVSPQAGIASETDYFRSLDTLDRRSIITTYAEVFGSNRIVGEAVASLGESVAVMEDYTVTAVGLPEANVIQVTVEGPDPAIVMQIANAIGERSTEYIEGLYFMYAITLLDSPSVPKGPISPTPLRDALVAAILGLAVGAVLAVAYVSLTDRQREYDEEHETAAETTRHSNPAVN
ncbi:MAG: hypothetical protein IPM39_01150 [Chloroflexi bacterium]|nr:hypothetical protein [Chloroflexota bacterium]